MGVVLLSSLVIVLVAVISGPGAVSAVCVVPIPGYFLFISVFPSISDLDLPDWGVGILLRFDIQ